MRRLLIFIAAIILVPIIGTASFLVFGLSPLLNKFKPDIEKQLSESLRKEVRINGPLRARFIPYFSLQARDIEVMRKDKPFLKADAIQIDAPWILINDGALNIRSVKIDKPSITWRQGIKAEKPPPAEKKADSFWVGFIPRVDSIKADSVVINSMTILITRPKGKLFLATKGFDSVWRDVYLRQFADVAKSWRYLLLNSSCRAKASAEALETPQARLHNVELEAQNRKGRIDFSSIQTQVGSGHSEGDGTIDMSKKPIAYALNLKTKDVDLSKIVNHAKPDLKIKGHVKSIVRLNTKGDSLQALRINLNGLIDLNAVDIVIPNIDIDGMLENYEDSRSLGLFDIGAFVVAGPLGLLISKSYDVSSLLITGTGEGNTEAPNLRLKIKMAKNVATLQDVAFSTKKNRVAAKGGVDLETMEFKDFEVALLNEEGCAKFTEKLEGTLVKPSVGSMSFVGKVLISPITTLYDKVSGLVSDCDAFYSGSVPHPVEEE